MSVNENDKTVLGQRAFIALHNVILAWPTGHSISEVDSMSALELLDLGLIKQEGFVYLPTEKGVRHMMPKKGVKQISSQMVNKILMRVP